MGTHDEEAEMDFGQPILSDANHTQSLHTTKEAIPGHDDETSTDDNAELDDRELQHCSRKRKHTATGGQQCSRKRKHTATGGPRLKHARYH